MKQKKAVSILCLVLAVIMILSLVISVLPARAYAVSQSDIEAMKAKRDAITARKEQAQGVNWKRKGILTSWVIGFMTSIYETKPTTRLPTPTGLKPWK